MSQKTILIVEDADIYQAMLSRIVEKAGFAAEVCGDGMQAMIRTNANMDNVAAILLDIYMPEIDGISMLGHLRSKYPHVPVHVISGTEEPEDKTAVLNLGAASFTAKPLNGESIATLTAVLKT